MHIALNGMDTFLCTWPHGLSALLSQWKLSFKMLDLITGNDFENRQQQHWLYSKQNSLGGKDQVRYLIFTILSVLRSRFSGLLMKKKVRQ